MPVKLEKKLKAKARKMGLSPKRTGAYVYGTMRKTGWRPKRETRRRSSSGDILYGKLDKF